MSLFSSSVDFLWPCHREFFIGNITCARKRVDGTILTVLATLIPLQTQLPAQNVLVLKGENHIGLLVVSKNGARDGNDLQNPQLNINHGKTVQ